MEKQFVGRNNQCSYFIARNNTRKRAFILKNKLYLVIVTTFSRFSRRFEKSLTAHDEKIKNYNVATGQ